MSLSTERVARSFLFVPGDRSERFDKAVATGAHAIILDLEDAVAPAAKAKAREAAAAWLRHGQTAIVRINGADTSEFQHDIAMVRAAPNAVIMLPKADAESVTLLASAAPGRSIIALLETVRGYIGARALAHAPNVSRIAFGSVDFSLESGIADEGEAMTAIRTQIVLESRFAGLAAPIDGVSVGFDDEALMRAQALRSKQLGFGGKLCIHPKQVGAVNAAFRPEPARVDWARRVLAAFDASGGAVTTVDGKMVDKPVVEEARRIMAEADAD